jgi:hypothetical protein
VKFIHFSPVLEKIVACMDPNPLAQLNEGSNEDSLLNTDCPMGNRVMEKLLPRPSFSTPAYTFTIVKDDINVFYFLLSLLPFFTYAYTVNILKS